MDSIITYDVSHKNLLLEESFEDHLAHYDHLPWLQEIKKNAWKRFQEFPMPRRVDEKWRFANLENLSLNGYHLPQTEIGYEHSDIKKQSSSIKNFAGRVIFEDNHLLEYDYISHELSNQGVIWEPISEAFENHPDLLKKYFARAKTQLGGDKFFFLNIAYGHAGSFLYLPKGVESDVPLLAFHWAQNAGAALFPQTIIVAEANSKASLIDVYASHAQNSSALAISLSAIYAEQGANISRKVIQNWNEETLSFQIDSMISKEQANIKTIAVNLGGKYARFENQISIEGEDAQADLYSLTVANNGQQFDQRSFQKHMAPNAISNLLYKNALWDNSHAIFSGMIKVDPVAQKTDAYQTNRNLLLSDNAEVNSLPGLEIEANDVKCSHGATSGKLDESDLFYMLSRGIPKSQAQELLVFGFFEEILDKIENEELINIVHQAIKGKLGTTTDHGFVQS